MRNRLAMDTVNSFVAMFHQGDNPLWAFLRTYHRFPTIAHESMLALFILGTNGLSQVTFDDTVSHAAWFSTLWTLIGAAVL